MGMGHFCKRAFTAIIVTASMTACQINTPSDEKRPYAALNAVLAGGKAFPQTTSVLIQQDGHVRFEKYMRDGSRSLLNNTRSATKSVTAMGIGAALMDGKIKSIDDPVFSYLAAYAPFQNDGPAKQAITIRDLLKMQSALDCDDSNPESPGNEENMYPKQSWVRWAADVPVKDTPEKKWAYCTAGTVLLGAILTDTTGKRADAYIEDRILKPMGIKATKWFISESGEPMTGGGLELTSRDLAKLGQLTLDHGKWEEKQILPATFMQAALTAHNRVNEFQSYGYLFWHRKFTTPTCGSVEGWYMAGNGGNMVLTVPKLHAVIVITRTRYNTRGMHQETIDLVEKYALPPLLCKSAIADS